eukprot:TRINITY_DN47670_c0_g1_i1.p1 TRINITY_DN47670_c0_g1~~TRINITY_DN47670_c0_g1_i1.p1  ORF type:complete len:635 (+),score=104.26 TRINITY_DN47670_c0_g1_i1:32-1906(+)
MAQMQASWRAWVSLPGLGKCCSQKQQRHLGASACMPVRPAPPQSVRMLLSSFATLSCRSRRSVRRLARLRDSEGRRILEAPCFDATDASQILATHEVQYTKRPFGVLAYAPSLNGKGAMVWELGSERYPGDPQGRARSAGVEEGFVVKAVNGCAVADWHFQDIMDLLADKILDNSSGKFQSFSKGAMNAEPAPLPLKVEYAKLQPTALAVGAEPVEEEEERYQEAAGLPSNYLLEYCSGCTIDDGFLRNLLEVQKVHAGRAVFSIGDALRLVEDATRILKSESTMPRIHLNTVVVVGDLHGQFFDLLRIFEALGLPSEANPYLFNGDFVDRGDFSLEVILTLLAFKIRYPAAVCLNRGNHEAVDLNLRYGFAAEIRARYGSTGKQLFNAFSEAFRWLPLAHVLNSEVLVVHGGLPGPDPRHQFADEGGGGTGYDASAITEDGRSAGRRGGGQNLSLLGYNPDNVSLPPRQKELSLDDIAALPRGCEPSTNLRALDHLPEAEAEIQRLIVDLLWADPRGKTGYGPSYRVRKGCYIFGPDVTKAFLKRNGLRLMIRSHEVKVSGYEWTHPECITVFSAPNYLGHAGNKGAVVKLTRDEELGCFATSFVTFEPQDRQGSRLANSQPP